MYRVWYSTESFADFIIDKTFLSTQKVVKNKMYESDANNPNNFHTMPDHIRKILYLDAPDLIVERNNEPIFSIEVTTEAGTGHNAFQRFARIAASVENSVPAFYIYPAGKIIARQDSIRWDEINPLIFAAMEGVMNIYNIPALLYYFPTDDIDKYKQFPKKSPHFDTQGLIYDKKITKYTGCPDSNSESMKNMFDAINEVLNLTENEGVINSRNKLLSNLVIRKQRQYMQHEFEVKSNGKSIDEMSPVTAVNTIPTEYLLNYLSKFEKGNYRIGELLRKREYTCLYQVDACFRGDPYPGCVAALDYIKCREGKTFEDRKNNLVMVWGNINIDDDNKTIIITRNNNSKIKDFCKEVKNCSRHNLLLKKYNELTNCQKPRYFMQVRYGSTYSKVKHIRVYSYFLDAILFPDGYGRWFRLRAGIQDR